MQREKLCLGRGNLRESIKVDDGRKIELISEFEQLLNRCDYWAEMIEAVWNNDDYTNEEVVFFFLWLGAQMYLEPPSQPLYIW